MINLGSSTFECDTLFYQPTYKCANNCHDCYVKTGAATLGSLEGMSGSLVNTFIDEVITNRQLIKTKQFTIAIDCLPWKDLFVDKLDSVRNLLDPFNSFVTALKQKSSDIEVHATVRSIKELERVLYASNTLFDKPEIIENLDMISISNLDYGWETNIKRLRKICPGAKINLNTSVNTLVFLDKDITNYLDMIYILLTKPVLGATLPSHISELDDFMMVAKNKISKFTQPDKVVLDHCVSDAYNYYKDNNKTCPVGITRFTVWPTGRVTGCAYNSTQHFGKSANYLSDIVDNLKDARNRYDFNNCTLPNSFVQLRRSKKDANTMPTLH